MVLVSGTLLRMPWRMTALSASVSRQFLGLFIESFEVLLVKFQHPKACPQALQQNCERKTT